MGPLTAESSLSLPSALTIVGIGISFLAVVVIPLLVLVVRSAVRWSRVESQLENLVDDVRRLVEDKDRVHSAIIDQMGKDREATNVRLRWLEEHLWKWFPKGKEVA